MSLKLFLASTLFSSMAMAAAMNCNNPYLQNHQFIPAADKASIKELCTRIEAARLANSNLKNNIDALKTKQRSCAAVSGWDAAKAILGNAKQENFTELEACAREQKGYETQIASQQATLSQTETSLEQVQAKYVEIVGKAVEVAADKKIDAEKKAATDFKVATAKEVEANIENYFSKMNLSLLSAQVLNMQATGELDKIARAMDQSVLGLYMRDRMAGLLNSKAMCSAVAQCPNPREIKGTDLNEAFSGKLSTSVQNIVDATQKAAAEAAAKPAVPAAGRKSR